MTASVKAADRGVFSRTALANSLCTPPLSPITTMANSGLGERVRKLQEMLMERQAAANNYPRYNTETRLHDRKTIVQNHYNLPRPSSRVAEYSASSSPRTTRNIIPEKPAILIERCEDSKSSIDVTLKRTETPLSLPKNGAIPSEPVQQQKEIKEKEKGSRTVRKYLGNLTSTRYLHHIFSPILKDSSSEPKTVHRTTSGKQGFLRPERDNNVCAIVVPTDSTTQVPVIKRRSWVKEVNSSDEMKDDKHGKNEVQHTEDHGISSNDKGTPAKGSFFSDKNSLRGSDERRRSKRLSLLSDDKSFKLPFLHSNVVNSCRPKSAIYDLSVDQNIVKTNAKEAFTDERSSGNHGSGDKLVKKLSFKMLGVVRNGSLKRDSSFRQKVNEEEQANTVPSTKVVETHTAEMPKITLDIPMQDKQEPSAVGAVSPVESRRFGRPSLVKQRSEPERGIEYYTNGCDHSLSTPNHLASRLGTLSHLRDNRRPLPPLLEVQGGFDGNEGGNVSDVDSSVFSSVLPPRRPLKYGRSNTTSTYNGYKDSAPDASPRRHLIGFLHRTSHLSLTSELSADASFYLIGHRAGRRFDDSTIGSESDARLFSDDDERSRVSTSTDITSVSRQHQANAYRKRRSRRKFRQPSRASSFSSITESSMSLDVITVTLNMDTVTFLGISIVGQSSSRGDNGIYVANIMKGGAVALDGRIEPGDMILQVNDISFENFTNDQAVDVLKESVARRGPIKLTVAKMYDGGPRSAFTVPRRTDEPVRPIDTQAWVQHTNAMRGMPSILEGSEGAPTPIPSHYGRPPSSSTVTSNGSAPNTIVGGAHMRLDTGVSKIRVVQAMAMPNSGLEIKDRTWLKIPIPMSFLGSELVDWLMEHVDGLRDRKEARKYASDLLKEKLICHAVSRSSFTEQCYYKLGDECSDFVRMRQNQGLDEQGVRSEVGVVFPPPPTGLKVAAPAGARNWQTTLLPQGAPSMVSGYASMPISPYPTQNLQGTPGIMMTAGGAAMMYKGGGGPDVHSQASSADGSSGSEHRRAARAILPPAPVPSLAVPPHHLPMGTSVSLAAGPSVGVIQNTLGELPQDLTSSRQSFRIAMSQPFEFFVDNL